MKSRSVVLLIFLLAAAAPRARGQSVETHTFGPLNLAIPDGNASGLSDRQTVTSSLAQIGGLKVRMQVAGEFNGDLYAYVRHVQGTTTNFCVLLNRVGRTSGLGWGYGDDGLDVTFDQGAVNGDIHVYQDVTVPAAGVPLTGAWMPDGRAVDPSVVLDTTPSTTSLNSFNGDDPNGEWTLFVADMDSGATNMLVGWEVEITGGMVPDITWPTPAAITYGAPINATQLNASSSAAGSFSYSPISGTVLNAGAGQILSATFTPADLVTYAPVTTTVAIDVQTKGLTITADSAGKLYGAALPTLSLQYTGLVNGDTSASLDTPPTLSTTALASSSVATYPITVSGAADVNYTISYVAGILTVNPADSAGIVGSSVNPAVPGASVTFSIQLSAVAPGAGVPTGTVQFTADGFGMGSPVVLTAGAASLNVSSLTAGLHSIAATYGGDANFNGTTASLSVSQLINTAPVANTDTVLRYPAAGAKVLISTLLANDDDADGNSFDLLSVAATSANGATLALNGEWVTYTPPVGFTGADSFTYTIRDSHDAEGPGTVQVQIDDNLIPSPNLTITTTDGGILLLQFDGIPGITYRVQMRESLGPEAWVDLGSQTADDAGMFEFPDSPPPSSPTRFYRSVYP